jgi:2-methylcitrate dehydratase PrpD
MEISNLKECSPLLANFAASLQFDAIPNNVIRRSEELFLDWLGATLAGRTARPVKILEEFCRSVGPSVGKSEVLGSRRTTSHYFAAMLNAAASHYVEQDDVHNGSVFHPAAVVFPAAFAVAQSIGASGRDFLTASIAGYEVGIRVGEFLGRSHYRIFHTTGTAGTLAAAAAVGKLLNLSQESMLDALGNAGTQAAGLWEFLRDAADSKQLHTAKAAGNGLMSAYLARDGFKGAKHILEGVQGMGAGMSSDASPACLVDRLGSRWAVLETSFKYHASCRHTHPAADALQRVIAENGLKPADILEVIAHVHQGAIDVLGSVVNPVSIHQAKFSMGTVLGLIVYFARAGVQEFEMYWDAPEIIDFRKRVTMIFDDEVDRAYPKQWLGKVQVKTVDGRVFCGRVDEPKGDPGNTLSRKELENKALDLAKFAKGASFEEMDRIVSWVWTLSSCPRIGLLLTGEDL